MNSIPVSVRYMFLSALFFAMMGGCVKAAHFRGIPVLEILAFRALVSSVLSYLDIRRKRISPWGKHKGLLILRGLLGTIALVCVFYAVTLLPLAEATLLQYFYPVFTSILAYVFLKENIQGSTLVCMLLCLVGLLFMVQPGFLFGEVLHTGEPLSLFGITCALLGAFGTGCAYVVVRRLSATEDPSVIIFYFPFIALPVSSLLLGDDFVMPTTVSTWIILLLVGVFTQIAQYGLTMAIKTEKAAKATAYSYVQVLFSAVIGWLFFSEIPDSRTFLGALFIIGGAFINLKFQTKQ